MKLVFFFWSPLRSSDASAGSGLTRLSPHREIYVHTDSKLTTSWQYEAWHCQGDTNGSINRSKHSRCVCHKIPWTPKAMHGEATQLNRTIDRTWKNCVPPQDVQLNLAMPRLASNARGPAPAFSFWPYLAVQVMTEGQHR